MKKQVIALAVAAAVAAPAMAQNVTVYGNLDTGYSSVDYGNVGGTAGANQKITDFGATGRLSSSRIGIKGSEDLGGGLKAQFQWEAALASDTGVLTVADATRVSTVGVSGAFGSIDLGRNKTPAQLAFEKYTASGATNAIGHVASAADSNTTADNNILDNAAATRASNAIFYTSPNFNGFTVMAVYGNSTQDDQDGTLSSNAATRDTGLRVDYTNGPLDLTVATHTNKARGVSTALFTKETVNVYGASYAFGPAKVFAQAISFEGKDTAGAQANKETATEFGLRYTFGGGVAGWVSAYDGSVQTTATAAEGDLAGYQLGVAKDLSKRTSVYAIYGKAGYTPTSTEISAKGFYAGINHKF